MMWAPPASPAWSAIQPASRPITSTIMTRWWDSAVVWMRSMASVATCMRGVKAEGDVGGREVIVNGLGNADDGQTFGGQVEADLLGAIAADDHESVQAHDFGVMDDFVGEIAHCLMPVIADAVGEGIAAIGGAKDGPAAGQNAAHVIQHQGTAFFRPDEAVKAVANANDFIAILEDGGFNGGADDCVETRAVSPAGTDANFSDLSHA